MKSTTTRTLALCLGMLALAACGGKDQPQGQQQMPPPQVGVITLKAQTVPEGSESTLSIEEVLDELIAPLGIPAIANVPVGHGKHMATMPFGTQVRLDAGAKTLEVTEAAVERL